jgi:hypothetical protein
MKNVIFVDYENVQSLRFEKLINQFDIIIMVGNNQNKIPLDLVRQTQAFGSSVKWIKVNGIGKNALDFFIAFYLGRFVEKKAYENYYIVSKDNGYVPLVTHLKELGMKVERIVSIDDIDSKKIKTPDDILEKVTETLRKIDTVKRPKKEKSLKGTIKTIQPKCSKEEINKIVEDLLKEEKIHIVDGNVKYNLN